MKGNRVGVLPMLVMALSIAVKKPRAAFALKEEYQSADAESSAVASGWKSTSIANAVLIEQAAANHGPFIHLHGPGVNF